MAEVQTQTLSQISRKIERFLSRYGINIKRTKPISSIIELKSEEQFEESINEKEKESLESLVLLMGFKLSEQWKFIFRQGFELIKVFRNSDIKITIDYIGNEKGIVLKKIIIEKIEKVE